MRLTTTLCLLVLLLALPTPRALAEDPPAPEAPPKAKEDGKDEQPGEGKEDDGADAEKPAEPAQAETPKLDPLKDYPTLMRTIPRGPRAQMQAESKRRASEYLEKWNASGQTAAGMAQVMLGRLQHIADAYGAAQKSFREAAGAEGAALQVQGQAMLGLAALLRDDAAVEALRAAKQTPSDIELITSWATSTTDPAMKSTRGNLHRWLGDYYVDAKKNALAIDNYMLAAEHNPTLASTVARTLARLEMEGVYQLDAYPALATSLGTRLDKLTAITKPYLAELNAQKERVSAETPAPDADAQARRRYQQQLRRVESQISRTERSLQAIERYKANAAKLGQPAPAWTLGHAFGDLQKLDSLKGKVVVLDFWATWCPWCIRSFPAIRDVLKDYADKDLAFVGVTASASVVYEARYSLDDDLKERAEGQPRATPVARLARGTQAPDPQQGVLEESAYKLVEIDTIKKFIENHEMTWPVVMIDNSEPGPKYGLGGWPHAVILDKQGRIRYFKSGALLRDRKEAIAKFRKVLDDLLAEE